MTLEEAFQNYKAANASAAYCAEKFFSAKEKAEIATAEAKTAEKILAGMLGKGAYIHDDQVFVTFANLTISASPIRTE